MSNSITELQEWLHGANTDEWYWYLKRLSCNDTGQTGGHQVGVYLPNKATFFLFPAMDSKEIKNPDALLNARIDSHSRPEHEVRSIYYNNKFSEGKKGGRDESRITRWKSGDSSSPLQDVINTGALTLFAFQKENSEKNCAFVKVWVCKNEQEEEYLEDIVGRIYPGENLFSQASVVSGGIPPLPETNAIKNLEIPEAWKTLFPSAAEIVQYAFDINTRLAKEAPDQRLLKRRDLEFRLFRMIEDAHLLPQIGKGFSSVEDFVKLANSVSNRRKSRGGKSLELHLEKIFEEEEFHHFSTQAVTEGKKKPDFLFPSEEAYHDSICPEEKLRMLAVKTTCKDRWRQILNEAHRIKGCHLFTLQEGVSENQFNEMEAEGVTLVVPKKLVGKYPKGVRSRLVTLESFIKELKELYC